MKNNVNTNLERIIAKIDNDFNPDNSDWIPRVGAWCIDAMSIIGVTPTIKVKKQFKVIDNIAYSNVPLDVKGLRIYDDKGCEIKELEEGCRCGDGDSPSSTGEFQGTNSAGTISAVYDSSNKEYVGAFADTRNSKDVKDRYNVADRYRDNNDVKHNYVLVDNNKIELNFNTSCITVEYEGIKTECSKVYGCELPVIPNNGKLIEAIVYYCMYKMLCRGYKHPVFNLNASQYGTNPYYIWTQLKEEAKVSVINDGIDENAEFSKLMRSNMFISTFDSRK